MAKTCSNSNFFESSPSNFYLNDMFSNVSFDDIYNNEYCGVIKPDPIDLFDELPVWPTIHSDIQKIESDNMSSMSFAFSFDEDQKPEIRNGDCMWSGSAALLSTSASSTSSDSVPSTAVPLSAVTGNTAPVSQQQSQPIVIVANNRKLQQAKEAQSGGRTKATTVKEEPSDDYEQQLQQHSIPKSRIVQSAQAQAHAPHQTQTQTQSMQHIPPGTSLLRKSNAQAQQLQLQRKQQKYIASSASGTTAAATATATATSSSTPKLCTAMKTTAAATATVAASAALSKQKTGNFSYSYFATNSLATAAGCGRPDTPQSLDDDGVGVEFKHSVDLAACVIGSNNISLTADPTAFINHVSQELQDTSKDQIETRLINGSPSLAEVYDVIDQDCATYTSGILMSSASSAQLRSISDCESDEESMLDSRCDSYMDGDGDLPYAATSPVPSQNSCSGGSSSSHHQQPYLHSDHSYTRCKDGMDDLGPSLETPSDSDEEIDVVSIGDKKLPTNPSDKDRRALQTKVAYKFSNARIVKTANGLRTLTPRRRISYELPYTPASSSPVKSVANSRYPSPASTPYQNKYAQQHMLTLLGEGAAATPASMMHDKARKRVSIAMPTVGGGASTFINGVEYALPPNKKHRGKKIKHHHHNQTLAQASVNECVSPLSVGVGGGGGGVCGGDISPATSPSDSGCGSSLKRHFSIDEAADTIEKRNLHNDMERQRRIGLKNLFESLKKQIPSIKDKERAPKVNILREAAKLCEALTRDDKQLGELLKEQMRMRQELLGRLRAVQHD